MRIWLIYLHALGAWGVEDESMVTLLDGGVQAVVSQEVEVVYRPAHVSLGELDGVVADRQGLGDGVVAGVVGLDAEREGLRFLHIAP